MRVARSRELVARGRPATVVATVAGISRQAIYRRPGRPPKGQRRPLAAVDREVLRVARENPTDGTRIEPMRQRPTPRWSRHGPLGGRSGPAFDRGATPCSLVHSNNGASVAPRRTTPVRRISEVTWLSGDCCGGRGLARRWTESAVHEQLRALEAGFGVELQLAEGGDGGVDGLERGVRCSLQQQAIQRSAATRVWECYPAVESRAPVIAALPSGQPQTACDVLAWRTSPPRRPSSPGAMRCRGWTGTSSACAESHGLVLGPAQDDVCGSFRRR
jgi:hypothetical protein